MGNPNEAASRPTEEFGPPPPLIPAPTYREDPEPGSSSGAPPVYANEPPAYVPSQTLPTLPDSVPAATTTTSAEPDTEEVVQPIMLVLAGESIHPRTASTNPPLYALERGFGTLSNFPKSVTLERLDTPTNSNSAPRARHIYDLVYDRNAFSAHTITISGGIVTEWWGLRSASRRRALPGSVELRPTVLSVAKHGFGHHGDSTGEAFKATHAAGSGPDSKDNNGHTVGDELFSVRGLGDKRVGWVSGEETSGAAGEGRKGKKTERTVAFEDVDEEGRPRLVVTVPLSRKRFDALVGLWCVRVWHDAAVTGKKHAWKDGRLKNALKMSVTTGKTSSWDVFGGIRGAASF